MATIAEQVGERASKQGDAFGKGLNEVMGVANFVQRTQQNRQNLEAQKQNMGIQKANLAINSLHSALKFKGPNRKRALNSVKNSLSQVFPNLNPDVIDAMGEDETSLEALKTLAPLVSQGVATPEQAGQIAEFMQGDMVSSMQMLQSLGAEQEKTKRAGLTAGLQLEKFELQKEKFEETKTERVRKRQAALSKEFVNKGFPALEVTFENLDKEIPGGIDKWDGEKIPGVGGKEALIPIGRLGAKGRRMRQLATGLGNQILKMRSGAQINESEARRILSELGIDQAVGEGGGVSAVFRGTRSDADFVQGIKDARKTLARSKSLLEKGFGVTPTVGGELTSPAEAPPAAPAAPVEELPGFNLEVLRKQLPTMDAATQAQVLQQISAETKKSDVEIKKLLGIK